VIYRNGGEKTHRWAAAATAVAAAAVAVNSNSQPANSHQQHPYGAAATYSSNNNCNMPHATIMKGPETGQRQQQQQQIQQQQQQHLAGLHKCPCQTKIPSALPPVPNSSSR